MSVLQIFTPKTPTSLLAAVFSPRDPSPSPTVAGYPPFKQGGTP